VFDHIISLLFLGKVLMTAIGGHLTPNFFVIKVRVELKTGNPVQGDVMSEETTKLSFVDFLKKHQVSVSVVGTTVVLATAFGSCSLSPSFGPVVEEVVEEVAEEEAPAVEEAPVEEEPEEAAAE
jgi:hypothetical protein